ncbi:MAG: hypothetical protein HY360_09630 [Verrucomicrobia bacterium]|nr:hypothetical protein [Verrucomicrobiota bacterium]
MTNHPWKILLATWFLGGMAVQLQADIKVRVWPDKTVYDDGEACAIKVYVTNTTASLRKVKLKAHVEYEIDTQVFLPEKELAIAGGKEEMTPLSWQPPKSVLGCGLVAQVFDGATLLAQGAEYFNVIDRKNIARVGIAGQTRISQSEDETQHAFNRFFVEEGLRKGYINIAELGAYRDAFAELTPNEDDLKNDFLGSVPYGVKCTKQQIQLMKENGIGLTLYATAYTNFPPGFELARQRPDLVMRYERGQASASVFEVKELENPQNFTMQHYKQVFCSWLPDQTSREALDIAIRELKKARSFWGIDGVRWDGHYSPRLYSCYPGHTFFNYKGEPAPPLSDSDRLTAQSMRYVKDAIWKEYPDYLFMANYIWPVEIPPDQRSEEHAVMLEKGGSACNEEVKSCSTRGHPYNRWADMSRLLVFQYDKAREYGGYAYAYAEFPFPNNVSLTFSRLQYPLFYAARNRPWFAAALYNHFLHGPDRVDQKCLPFSDAIRPITRFATRYSAVLFGYEIDRIKNPDALLTMTSPQPVWWKDYVHVRPLGSGAKQVTVDLLNPPTQEFARAFADETDAPPPQKNVALTLKLKPGETVTSAWYLSFEIDGMRQKLDLQADGKPGKEVTIYNPMTGQSTKAAAQPAAGTAKVIVPELGYWGIVVFNLRTR